MPQRSPLSARQGDALGLAFKGAALYNLAQRLPAFGDPPSIWGLPLALPPGRGSSLGSKLPGLCSAAERRAAAPAACLGAWEHGWVQGASGDPPFLWGLPLVLPLNGRALLGLLRRGCSSLSCWPQCLGAVARGQVHPASGGPLFPLGAPLKLGFCVAFSRTLCPGAGGAAGSGRARHF